MIKPLARPGLVTADGGDGAAVEPAVDAQAAFDAMMHKRRSMNVDPQGSVKSLAGGGAINSKGVNKSGSVMSTGSGMQARANTSGNQSVTALIPPACLRVPRASTR